MGQWGMPCSQLTWGPVCFGLPGGVLSYLLPLLLKDLHLSLPALPPSVPHKDLGEGWGQACVPLAHGLCKSPRMTVGHILVEVSLIPIGVPSCQGGGLKILSSSPLLCIGWSSSPIA